MCASTSRNRCHGWPTCSSTWSLRHRRNAGLLQFQRDYAQPPVIHNPPAVAMELLPRVLFHQPDELLLRVRRERGRQGLAEHIEPLREPFLATFERDRTVEQRRQTDFQT